VDCPDCEETLDNADVECAADPETFARYIEFANRRPEDGSSKREDEDHESKVTIEKTTKKCPRCATNIERHGGCDRISCTF